MHNRLEQNWNKLRNGKIDWTIFHFRAKTNDSIRTFFGLNNFLEVDPAILSPYPSLDSNIQTISACVHTLHGINKPYYLHTSPEHTMKKLISGGARQIYYLGKVFRDSELTRLHNPEFTLTEWYRCFCNYHDIIKDTQELILHIIHEQHLDTQIVYQGIDIDLSPPWPVISMKELFKNKINVDLSDYLTTDSMKGLLDQIGIHYQQKDDWDVLFYRIFLERIEPGLGIPKPLFLIDYPVQLGLMARKKEDDPLWVERCELYIAGLELANGYSELIDPQEQKERFEIEQMNKKNMEKKNYPIDKELLQALEMSIPECAGMALGVDRLIMLLADKSDIQDVILFPFSQW